MVLTEKYLERRDLWHGTCANLAVMNPHIDVIQGGALTSIRTTYKAKHCSVF